MKNVDLIAAILKKAGVRYVFGVPSGPTLPLMEGLRKGGLEYVLVASESSAGFMADVVGRLTGTPGVCLSTLGPGATNLATGVGNAYLDRAPALAITCTVPIPLLGRRVQMAIDHRPLFSPLTKASFLLREGEVGARLKEAIRIALSEPPGPVHLDLPEDVSSATADEPVGALEEPLALSSPSAADLLRVGDLLGSARRPLVALGLSVTRSGARKELLSFIEANRLPFVTTLLPKGYLPDDHPLNAGVIGRARRSDVHAFAARADLLLGIGYDPVEINYEEWVSKMTPLVHVDGEPADLDGSLSLLAQAIGDLTSSIRYLADLPPSPNEWTEEELSDHRLLLARALRPAGYRFPPHEVLDLLREELPREGILCYDVGAHTHQIATQWPAYELFTCLCSNGWSSMGYGIPAALAAKLVRPERPVVCVVGDGCFQMTVGEMATARRLGLPVPFIVLNDGWLSLIRVKQERKNLGIYGVELALEVAEPPPHYFGVPCRPARSGEEFREAVRWGLRTKGPTVIEAFIDSREYSETVYD